MVRGEQDDTQGDLWPATGGKLPSTPAEWVKHLDFMAERGRQLRAAQAGQRRRRLLAQAVDGGDGQAVARAAAAYGHETAGESSGKTANVSGKKAKSERGGVAEGVGAPESALTTVFFEALDRAGPVLIVGVSEKMEQKHG
jgi:hypothetical protein